MSHNVDLSIGAVDDVYRLKQYLETKSDDAHFREPHGEEDLEIQRWISILSWILVQAVNGGWHPPRADDAG